MQNLKQKDMTMKEYTKEFYRLDTRSRNVDDDVEKIVRYINGLGSRIQDEIIFVKLESVEEAYQYALKAEEILTKKHEQRQRGRGGRFQRGRGRSYGERGRSESFVVVFIKEVLDLTKEEVILILEMVSVVIISDVVKKGIDILNVDLLKMGKIIKML